MAIADVRWIYVFIFDFFLLKTDGRATFYGEMVHNTNIGLMG